MSIPNALDMFSLKDKVAVVTGGARDLGFDIAQTLAQAGYAVGIRASKGVDIQAACGQLSAKAGVAR